MKETAFETDQNKTEGTKSAKGNISAGRQSESSAYNPYLAARQEWNERYGDLLTRARNWRVIALICAASSVLLTAGFIMVSMRSRIVPYVVAVDSIGRAASQGPAAQAAPADERLVRAAVLDWVADVRTISSDQQVQLRAIDKVYAMMGKGSAAETFITDYYKANDPFSRAATGTVSTDVHSVVASSDQTFEVQWTETTRDTRGAVKETATYQGSFTTAVNPPRDEQTIRLNPLGVYITHVSWSKVL